MSFVMPALPIAAELYGATNDDAADAYGYTERYDSFMCGECGETELFWVYYTLNFTDGDKFIPEDDRIPGSESSDTLQSDLSDQSNQPSRSDWQDETDPARDDFHYKMTMCLNCGTINGDLPTDSEAFGLNIFRRERCPFERHNEDTEYEVLDAEHHLMTASEAAYCPLCEKTLINPIAVTESHGFFTEVTAPSCTNGGFTVTALSETRPTRSDTAMTTG